VNAPENCIACAAHKHLSFQNSSSHPFKYKPSCHDWRLSKTSSAAFMPLYFFCTMIVCTPNGKTFSNKKMGAKTIFHASKEKK
jgi:hypothetical protein